MYACARPQGAALEQTGTLCGGVLPWSCNLPLEAIKRLPGPGSVSTRSAIGNLWGAHVTLEGNLLSILETRHIQASTAQRGLFNTISQPSLQHSLQQKQILQ